MKSLISRIPGKMGGQYTIRGTRLTVQMMKALLADGYPAEHIQRMYPYPEVTPESIAACARFMTPAQESPHG